MSEDEFTATCAWCEETRTFPTQKEWRESGWLIFIRETEDGDGEPHDFCSMSCAVSSE